MKHRDDEQLETYLQQFRPLAAGPLPVAQDQTARRPWRVPLWTGAAAALVIVAVLAFRFLPNHQSDSPQFAGATRIANSEPLTIRAANQLLSQAASTKAALDDIAFQAHTVPPSHGTQSALKVLSKEDRL